jgi:hypothetical protein
MREDEEKVDERTYTWALDPVTGEALLDPVTGDPYLVASRPRTPQEIADDEVVDAIWQKLYDNPSLDPEMWNLMFGPEPEEELTEEEIEEMERTAIPWELANAESHRRLEVLATESRKRLRTGEPRLSKAETKAIMIDGDFSAAARIAAQFDALKGGPVRMEPDPVTGEPVLLGGDRITEEEVENILTQVDEEVRTRDA